jgi:hypothetical protein
VFIKKFRELNCISQNAKKILVKYNRHQAPFLYNNNIIIELGITVEPNVFEWREGGFNLHFRQTRDLCGDLSFSMVVKAKTSRKMALKWLEVVLFLRR